MIRKQADIAGGCGYKIPPSIFKLYTMEIKGKVHCFFEQSGTFKNEFIKLGIPAEDYDIQDNFGETDHKVDLFKEIESAYEGGASLFDSITCDDLIMAFFPCIYFCEASQCAFKSWHYNYRNMSNKKMYEKIIERIKNRAYFFTLFNMMFCDVKERGLRMIVENPYSEIGYLHDNFDEPTFIDHDRQMRGDYFKKPTQYWFINVERLYGETLQTPKKTMTIRKTRPGIKAGLCSEERSMISPDYARNFICDFILGKVQKGTQLSLFDNALCQTK